MPKRGFWNDRNHYQAQEVRYVVGAGEVYRLVVAADGSVQGYGVYERWTEDVLRGKYSTISRKFLSLLPLRILVARKYGLSWPKGRELVTRWVQGR